MPQKGYQKKDHKYISRIWKNGKWIYEYVKKGDFSNFDKDITGWDYTKEAMDQKQKAQYANMLAGHAPKGLNAGADVDNVKKDGSADFTVKTPDQWASSAAYHGRKAAEAEAAYRTKSLQGRAESALERMKNRVRKHYKKKK
jgi:hypothetical protein